MAHVVLMPALSPTMEKGRLAKWLVKEGDAVSPGDVIAEIETDKATVELETDEEGVIVKLLVGDGAADIAINTPIAVIAEEGEHVDVDKLVHEAGASGGKPVENAGDNAVEKPLASGAEPVEGGGGASASTMAATATGQHQVGSPAVAAAGGRIFATPLARRLAKEKGIDLARISGSGPRGRIIRRDVEAAIASGGAAAAGGAATMPAAALSDAQIFALYPQGSYDLKPLDAMRRTIAQRLTLAKQTIPHFYLTIDCAIDRLLEARQAINARAPKDDEGKPLWKLSVNDFVLKAWALALAEVPEANATWAAAGVMVHQQVDVAVAVAIDGGLITPVVRGADTLPLPEIARQVRDLATRARARKLKPAEYQGGTTSVSNLGMYGVDQFAAVINPPQATILAVGRGVQRVVAEDGRAVVRTMMTVTLSCDHRAVDGALGAQALAAFKRYIEEPALLLFNAADEGGHG